MNRNQAYIPAAKLAYLLNAPSKRGLYREVFGFSDEIADDLW